MNEQERLSRRALLGQVTILTGGLLSAPLLALARGSAKPATDSSTGQPLPRTVWSVAQRQLVIALADTIIPETDTPGATLARVDEFIVHLLDKWCQPEERGRFLAGLNEFSRSCTQSTGKPFTSLTAEQRLAYLEPLDRLAVEVRQRGDAPLPFFATLKEFTLVGYYTSQVGAAAIGYLGPLAAQFGDGGPIDSSVWI